MPWCPKCKTEYYEGVKVCSECGSELVASLDDVPEMKQLVEGEKEQMERLFQFLQYNKIQSATIDYQEETEDYLVSCEEKEYKNAVKIAKIFLHQEEISGKEASGKETSEKDDLQTDASAADGVAESAAENKTFAEPEAQDHTEPDADAEEADASDEGPVAAADTDKMLFDGDIDGIDMENTIQDGAKGGASMIYKNNAEKAADNKSSAYTLIGVGLVGIVLLICLAAGILPIPMYGSTKYMIYGVMGAMFLIFLVMGIVSMRNASRYSQKAQAEDDLTAEIKKWCAENMTAEEVDRDLFTEAEAQQSNEQKYFKRYEKMKKMIGDNFLNLEPGYLDRFVDEYYTNVFSAE